MPYTSLLGLSLPTTGTLSGTWGDEVNNAITSLLDAAVAGTTTLSTDADVTLTSTDGVTNQARAAVILWTAGGTVTRNITAPARSKAYVVINATSSSQSIVIRGTGPTTGITVAAGRKVLVAWNGSDFVAIAGGLINLTTDVTGTLPIANGGTGTTSTTFADLTTNVTGTLPIANGGTNSTATATAGGVGYGTGTAHAYTLAGTTGQALVSAGASAPAFGTLGVAGGGTGATTLTANNVLLGNGTSALQVVAPGTNGNVLTSNGTTWTSATPSANVTSISFGSTGLTPSTATTGAVSVAGTLSVGNGGTGATTLTANNVLLGNGASAVQVVAPGTSGNVLTSNGTTWQSTTPAAQSYPAAGIAVSTGSAWTTSKASPTGTIVGTTDSQTLTNKTIEAGTFTNGYTEETYTANSSTAITLDLANGSFQIITLTGSATITMPTAVAGKSFILLLKSGAGSYTVTWSTVAWPSGTAPTLTSTASKQDIISFFSDGTKWYGTTVGLNYTP